MDGATVTVLVDRRASGAGDLARNLARHLRGPTPDEGAPVFLEPVIAREPRLVESAAQEQVVVADAVSALMRLPRHGDVVMAFRGPVRQDVLGVLDRSQLVVVLCDAGVPSLRAAQRTLRLFAEIGYPVGKVQVALLVDANAVASTDRAALSAALRRGTCHVLARVVSTPADAAPYQALAAIARRA